MSATQRGRLEAKISTRSDDLVETLTLHDKESLNRTITQLIRKTKHILEIYGLRLESTPFKSGKIQATLSPIIRADLHNRIRILVNDERYFRQNNMPLCELTRRFSSYIEVRKITKEVPGTSEFFLTVDNNGYIYQPKLDLSRAIASTDDPTTTRRLQNLFKTIWDRSEPIHEISRLGL